MKKTLIFVITCCALWLFNLQPCAAQSSYINFKWSQSSEDITQVTANNGVVFGVSINKVLYKRNAMGQLIWKKQLPHSFDIRQIKFSTIGDLILYVTNVGAPVFFENLLLPVQNITLSYNADNGVLNWANPPSTQTPGFEGVYDSTVVSVGEFTGNYTVGGTTITAAYSSSWGNNPDVYLQKNKLDGSFTFLKNATSTFYSDWHPLSLVDTTSGDIFLALNNMSIVGDHAVIKKFDNNGNFISDLTTYPELYVYLTPSFTQNEKYLVLSDELGSISLVKKHTGFLENYYLNGAYVVTPSTSYLDNSYNIYAGGNHADGMTRLSIKDALFHGQGFHTIHKCNGVNLSVMPFVSGGMPPYTYSWAPATGLSASNIHNPTVTGNTNTTYTVTITDVNGTVVNDTLDITIDNPLSPSISGNASSFCINPVNLQSNISSSVYQSWHLDSLGSGTLNTGTSLSLAQSGTVILAAQNACGLFSDTTIITSSILPITVTSSAPSGTCAGNSRTLNASSASTGVTYTWNPGNLTGSSVTVNPTSLLSTYTVVGVDAGGCTNSNVISLNSTCCPPSGLTITGNTTTSISISWTLVNPALTTYNIRYRDTTSQTWNFMSANGSSATITGLISGKFYEIIVESLCGNISTYTTNSVIACTTVSGVNCFYSPNLPVVSNITPFTAQVTWAAVPGVTSYQVRYKKANNPWVSVTVNNATTYTITGLASNSLYAVEISSSCGAGISANVGNVLFTTAISCNTPTGLSMSYIGYNDATAVWANQSGVTSFSVRYKPVSSATWIVTNGYVSQYSVPYCAFTNLIPSTLYEYQVSANCSNGPTAFSASKQFTTQGCVPVTGLTITNVGISSAQLNWTPNAQITNVLIKYRPIGSTTWNQINSATNGLILNSLVPFTTYEVSVENATCGISTSIPATGQFTTLCPVLPTNLIATNISSTMANLNWSSYNISMILRYKPTNASTWTVITSPVFTSCGINTNCYLLISLTPSTNYEFQLAYACNPTAFTASSLFTTTALGTNCNPPTNLSLSFLGTNSVKAVWTAPSTPPLFYTLLIKEQSSNTWTTYTNITSQPFTINGLNQTTAYEFQMISHCSANTNSVNSPSKLFTTPAPCGVPAGLSLSILAANTAIGVWDPVPGATSYKVRYKDNLSSTWTFSAYQSALNYTFSGLSAGHNYEFQVMANCPQGPSSYSNSKTFSTPIIGNCTIPVGLTLTSWGNTYATVKWNALVGPASYTLEYFDVNTGTTTIVNNLTTNTYLITGLSPSTQYGFKVKSNCTNNSSSYSTIKYFTTSSVCASTYDNANNNTSTGAAAIPLLTAIQGSINNATDIDYYKFTVNNSPNLYISLKNLPFNYNLAVYNSSMTLVGSSSSSGTNNEYVLLTSPASGTYYAKVVGVSGANSSTQCYTLKVNNNGTYLKPVDEESIEREASIEPIIFPNPTNGELNIQFTTKEASNYQVKVMDLAGKQIYASGEQTASIGEQTHTLRLGDYSIAEGVYIVVTTIGEQRYFQRVVYRK